MSYTKLFYLQSQTARHSCIQAILEAPLDANLRVEIKPRTRSLDQSAMLHALLGILSKTLPWTINGKETLLQIDEWKAVMTASVVQETRMAQGARGGFVMLGRRTSSMTVAEMSELIEFTIAFCVEQGVNIERHRKTITDLGFTKGE